MIRSRQLIVGTFVLAAVISGVVLIYHPWAKPRPHVAHLTAAAKRAAVRPSLAVAPSLTPSPTEAPTNRLKIPAIGVDAPIISLGLTSGGDLDAPKTLYQVGVYSGGPWPGQPGTAVVDGHSGAPGQVGVLEHLSGLKAGDEVNVMSADGIKTRFLVTDSKAYPAVRSTAQVLFAKTSAPTMNLISCYGAWDAKTQLYDQRWIVKATLAP